MEADMRTAQVQAEGEEGMEGMGSIRCISKREQRSGSAAQRPG